MSAPFADGDRALLIDRKGRRYLVTLRAGEQFHFHLGAVRHDDILGEPEGTRVHSTSGAPLIALRPSLADFAVKMPRGAQVIYPKDLASILVFADIAPGHTVVEAGTGSGALTLALLRAVGDHGRVISYDQREEFQERARKNIEAFLGKLPHTLELRLGDVAEDDSTAAVDRIVLDLPEPWRIVPVARRALRPGGIFCAYVPSILQIQKTVEELGRDGSFIEISPFETLLRPWHVEGLSVRPDHRMVAHTGFLVTARFLGV